MKTWKRSLLKMLTALTLISISACGPWYESGNNKDKGKDKSGTATETGVSVESGDPDKITICHKTGSKKNPYVEITVSVNALKNGHGAHADDIIPAPAEGCPEN